MLHGDTMVTAKRRSALAAKGPEGFQGLWVAGDQLSPARVAALFAVAASEKATKEGAVIVLCAATARFNAGQVRDHFSGDHERHLAMMLLNGGSFDQANKLAVKLVQKHWREIQKSRAASRSRSRSVSVSAYRCILPAIALMSRLASPSLAFADYRFISAQLVGRYVGLDPGLANKASFRPSVGGGKFRQSLC